MKAVRGNSLVGLPAPQGGAVAEVVEVIALEEVIFLAAAALMLCDTEVETTIGVLMLTSAPSMPILNLNIYLHVYK